jgi:hypothetical protein
MCVYSFCANTHYRRSIKLVSVRLLTRHMQESSRCTTSFCTYKLIVAGFVRIIA